jgi:hypothetical protein
MASRAGAAVNDKPESAERPEETEKEERRRK